MKSRAEILSKNSFSLSLSSGFFGFFAHLGFVQAFEENKLKPNLLSGSSAGALVAAGLASGRSVKDLRETFLSIQKNDFWDPKFGFGYLQGKKLEDLLEKYCVQNFSDTAIPLSISVFNINRQKTEFLTEGYIAKACRASAAVPILFHPVKIGSHYYWDGGIGDRAGAHGVKLSKSISVNHFLHASGIVSTIEDKFIYKKLHSDPYFLKIQSPYKMGPNALHKGKEVMEYFYHQTQLWLEEKI